MFEQFNDGRDGESQCLTKHVFAYKSVMYKWYVDFTRRVQPAFQGEKQHLVGYRPWCDEAIQLATEC